MSAMEDVEVEGEVLAWRVEFETNKHPIRPAFCSKRGCPFKTKIANFHWGGNTLGVKRVQLVGNVSNQGNEEQAGQGGVSTQKEAFSELICSSKGLSIHAKNGEHPLGNLWIHGGEGGPSIGMQKAESAVGAATFCPAMGSNSDGAKEERPLDKRGNQEAGVGAVQDLLIATNCTVSDLKCANKGLSSLASNGGKLGLPNRFDIKAENVANPMGKSWSQVVNNNVQHKGFTLEYMASCMKEDRVVV
ncbi:hypothetical protein F0562_032276 [Nyssa sinensis]|uniref:Uncharacterized protein n=1 Tax=Nyssa sinensis TaxID=561372 RepID=A0A5J5AMM0_9ASTE|nr:hypothetical protein F0562_032276 [Nyssa sinensis]